MKGIYKGQQFDCSSLSNNAAIPRNNPVETNQTQNRYSNLLPVDQDCDERVELVRLGLNGFTPLRPERLDEHRLEVLASIQSAPIKITTNTPTNRRCVNIF